MSKTDATDRDMPPVRMRGRMCMHEHDGPHVVVHVLPRLSALYRLQVLMESDDWRVVPSSFSS